METKVVHVSREPYDYYIGHKRPNIATADSPFCKPWSMGGQGREYAIISFAVYWFSPPQAPLRKLARDLLAGKILACWCAPLWCHGHIIAGYLNWKVKLESENWEGKNT